MMHNLVQFLILLYLPPLLIVLYRKVETYFVMSKTINSLNLVLLTLINRISSRKLFHSQLQIQILKLRSIACESSNLSLLSIAHGLCQNILVRVNRLQLLSIVQFHIILSRQSHERCYYQRKQYLSPNLMLSYSHYGPQLLKKIKYALSQQKIVLLKCFLNYLYTNNPKMPNQVISQKQTRYIIGKLLCDKTKLIFSYIYELLFIDSRDCTFYICLEELGFSSVINITEFDT